MYGNVLINDPINKIQTESDEAIYFKNEERMKLFGNVLINDSINKIKTESDEAIHFRNEERMQLLGNVLINDSINKIKTESDEAEYFKNEERMKLFGNVLINDSINKIKTESDEAEYFKNEERMKLFGNVLINDSINKIKTESDEAEYFKNEERMRLFGNVLINDSINKIQTESDEAEYISEMKNECLFGNVLINDSINKIKTESDEAEYFKNEERMKLFGNVLINDSINKIQTVAEEVLYYKKKDLLKSVGESETIVEEKYFLKSKDLIFDRSLMELSSDNYSKIRDNIGNSVEANNFKFKINKDLIYGKDITVSDSSYNIYNLKSGVVDLKDSKLAGKDINVDFYDLLFGNEDNEPRLTGKSIVSNIDKTKVYKGIFTTCAQKEDKCPPWTIYADEVTHIKENKIMKYKNAWLEIFDIPVFYTPFFFHPDPSVKRQSGFLTPSYRNSNIFNRSFQIPYFKVISDDKDMTISPELFVNNSILLQTEYREANKNSNLTLDLQYQCR